MEKDPEIEFNLSCQANAKLISNSAFVPKEKMMTWMGRIYDEFEVDSITDTNESNRIKRRCRTFGLLSFIDSDPEKDDDLIRSLGLVRFRRSVVSEPSLLDREACRNFMKKNTDLEIMVFTLVTSRVESGSGSRHRVEIGHYYVTKNDYGWPEFVRVPAHVQTLKVENVKKTQRSRLPLPEVRNLNVLVDLENEQTRLLEASKATVDAMSQEMLKLCQKISGAGIEDEKEREDQQNKADPDPLGPEENDLKKEKVPDDDEPMTTSP